MKYQPLIVVDGPDFSGKTSVVIPTIIETLYKDHEIKSYKRTQLGEAANHITEIYEESKRAGTPQSKEALKMAVYAANFYTNAIAIPNLREDDRIAITDRGIASFFAYQSINSESNGMPPMDLILSHYKSFIKPPVLYVYCDIDVDTMFERESTRTNLKTFDKESRTFKETLVKNYHRFYENCGLLGWDKCVHLDCTKPIETVRSVLERELRLHIEDIKELVCTTEKSAILD